MHWNGLMLLNQLRCRVLMNRLLRISRTYDEENRIQEINRLKHTETDLLPMPNLPHFQLSDKDIYNEKENNENKDKKEKDKKEKDRKEKDRKDKKEENLCVRVLQKKYFKKKSRLFIILPSNPDTLKTECFTMNIETGTFYCCKSLFLTPKSQVFYGYVLSVIITEDVLQVTPDFKDMIVCDVFCAEGSIYNKESISERIFFLRKLLLKDFPFQIMIPSFLYTFDDIKNERLEVINKSEEIDKSDKSDKQDKQDKQDKPEKEETQNKNFKIYCLVSV